MQRGIDQISDDRARSIFAEGLVCLGILAAMAYFFAEVL
jgi:hypothetical protein